MLTMITRDVPDATIPGRAAIACMDRGAATAPRAPMVTARKTERALHIMSTR